MHDEKTLRAIADAIAALTRLTEDNADWPTNIYLEVRLKSEHGDPIGAFQDELGEWMFEFESERPK